jgi:hypothetical protein
MTEASSAAPGTDPANPAGGTPSPTPSPSPSPTPSPTPAPSPTPSPSPSPSPTPAYDWRKEITGGDEKALKTFERFSTIQDAGKAYLEAVNKIRSGELAKPLAKDAKPEEVAAWRHANGIPEKPEGYFEKLPNGRVIGKDDLPMFNEVASKLHGHNIPPAAMHDLVEWYYGLADKESATISEADKAEARAAEDTLRKAWGDDYRANENHLENYITGLPEGLQKSFREGFGADGKKLMHNPDFKLWLANIAREFNPAGMVAVGGNEGQATSINDELTKLITMSGNQHGPYWKGPEAAKHQARHMQLIDAQNRLAARAR